MKKNKNTSTIWFWVIMLWNIGAISAQNTSITFTSVEQVLAFTLNKNPDLSVYVLQQEKAIADYKKNKNFYLPTISGSVNTQNNLALQTSALPGEIFGQPDETVNVQLGQQYNYNAGLSLSKTMFDRTQKLNAKISKISSSIAESQTEVFKQTLKEQAAFYYYSALIGKKALAISQEDLKTCDSIYQLTLQKFNEGIVDLTIKNQAAINRNTVQQSVITNQNIYDQNLNSLRLLLGVDRETKIDLPEKITDLDSPSFSHLFIKENKSLQVKSLQNEQSVVNIKQQQAAYLPKLSLNGYFGKQQLRDDIGVSFDNNSWSNYSYVGINLSIPIFSGFKTKQSIKVAKIDHQIALQNLNIEKAKSNANDALLLTEYARNIRSLKSSEENYLLTKENTDLGFLKYQQGLLSLDAYFKLYEDYLRAENNYLNTLSIVYSQCATIISRQ